MKLISRVFIFCTWNSMLVTGEQLFLLNTRNDIYRYDTVTKEAKKLANRARYMACDMERNFLYYTIQPIRNDQNFTKIIRIDEDGKNMQTISDEADVTIDFLCVDQESGNLYYSSTKGIGYLSFIQNYSNEIMPTAVTLKYVYDIGFHGKRSKKRVYWTTEDNIYWSQNDSPRLTFSKVDCRLLSVLDNGLVCGSGTGELYLVTLDGVKTKSLPDITITSSILNDMQCEGAPQDITTIDENMYILCRAPNQVLKMDLKGNNVDLLIADTPPSLPKNEWLFMCILPHQKVVSSTQTVNILPVSTILMITGAVVSGIVLIVVLAVAIRKFYKAKQDSMPRSSDNGPTEYSSCNDNRPKECHVYTTMHSTGYLDLNTMPPPIYEDIL